ncbi:Ig-like domain-containing protein [Mycolicibacterium elephantis]|uniref:Ig-like domain-containing protein n=1 Tax=Mycolicibacterium elephantis TaxID=81858 RepID=UPI000FE1BD70|nr:Ig-like domain-containing protein [Mycolicibacterium elephantis]
MTPSVNVTVPLSDGVITYTPDVDFHGTDSFTYTIADGNGGTATATVYVTVNPVNDAPEAVDDFVTVDEDSGATVVDVLGNDTDVEGDELTVTGVGTASNGTVTLTDGVITYTPDVDFHGTDSFTYTIADGNGGTASATVYVTVDPVNNAPVAVDDIVRVDENSTTNVIDVLGNDTDADGDDLSVTAVGPAGNGTVKLTDGVVTYTPSPDFDGTDSFTYTIGDGRGGSATATVTVTAKDADTITFDDGARPSETFLSDDGNRIYVLTGGELRIVDRATREWVDTVELGVTPSGFTMSRDGRYAYVGTNSSSGAEATAVRKVDLVTGRSTEIGAVRQPTAMALSADGGTLYVTNFQDGTVSVIDTATGDNRVIDVALRTAVIAVSEDNTTLYVGSVINDVGAVDVATGTYKVVYEGDWNYWYIADQRITVVGDRAYVTDGLNDNLVVIDTKSDEVIAVFDDVGPRPSSVAATREGDVILVATRGDGSVRVVSPEYGVRGAIEVGNNPSDIDFAVDADSVYVTVRDGISIVSAEDIYALLETQQQL